MEINLNDTADPEFQKIRQHYLDLQVEILEHAEVFESSVYRNSGPEDEGEDAEELCELGGAYCLFTKARDDVCFPEYEELISSRKAEGLSTVFECQIICIADPDSWDSFVPEGGDWVFVELGGSVMTYQILECLDEEYCRYLILYRSDLDNDD